MSRFAPWFDIAARELGTREIPGPGDHPRIVEYHGTTTLRATDDEVPWCSSFVNWCIREAKLPGTDSARARSWLRWGAAVSKSHMPQGAVVILSRGPEPQPGPDVIQAKGHVGFLFDYGLDGTVLLLGGNQRNSVSIAPYPEARILGARWPA